MGGDDVHETPPGWPHFKQCDNLNDVIKKGRVDNMYDESENIARMEREQKHLAKHSDKFKYHKEMNQKLTRQLTALRQKVESILTATVDYDWSAFQFLADTVELCQEARIALMYSSAFRYYLMGANRQAYFDRILDELETALDHLAVMADPNWFFYIQYVNGMPVLRDSFSAYRDRLEGTKAEFVELFTEFMPSVKTGMPDLPPDSIEPTTVASLPLEQQEEIELSPATAIVRTEHSHERGQEVRENLVKPGHEGWNKWLAPVHESWVEIDFKGKMHTVAGLGFKSANDCPERDAKTVDVLAFEKDEWKEVQTIELQWNR